MKELKVGERVTIEVVETATCTGCFFDSKNICNIGLKCANRSDGKFVIFKEVKE